MEVGVRLAKNIIITFIIFFYILLIPQSSEGKTVSIDLIYEGNLISSGCYNEDDIAYFYLENIKNNKNLYEAIINNRNNLKVANFALEKNLKTVWNEDTNCIILADCIEGSINHSDTEILNKLADNKWMFSKSLEEIREYFSGFLMGAILEKSISDAYEFIELDTDWHEIYEVYDIKNIANSDDWRVLNFKMKEIDIFGQVETGDILVILVKQENETYKIKKAKFCWK